MTENDLIELYCIIDDFYQLFIKTSSGVCTKDGTLVKLCFRPGKIRKSLAGIDR